MSASIGFHTKLTMSAAIAFGNLLFGFAGEAAFEAGAGGDLAACISNSECPALTTSSTTYVEYKDSEVTADGTLTAVGKIAVGVFDLPQAGAHVRLPRLGRGSSVWRTCPRH